MSKDPICVKTEESDYLKSKLLDVGYRSLLHFSLCETDVDSKIFELIMLSLLVTRRLMSVYRVLLPILMLNTSSDRSPEFASI